VTQALTPLDQVIAEAYAHDGSIEAANRVWMTLLRTTLYLPVEPSPPEDPEEAFRPLTAVVGEHVFLVAFDAPARIEDWAANHTDKIAHVTLTGRDLIAGMGETVFLALNPGMTFYKEFSPDEVKHLKKIVARLDQLKNP